MIESNSDGESSVGLHYREAVTNLYEDLDYRGRRPARNILAEDLLPV